MRRFAVVGVTLCGVGLFAASVQLASAQTRSGGGDDPTRSGPLMWDYNHDGVYTCEEWKRFSDQLFVAADKNRDGFIDAKEFPLIQKMDPALAEADLGYFDDNGDNKLSRKEFVDKPSPFILRFDSNGDCRVTPQELKGGGTAPQKGAPSGKGRHGGGGSFGGGVPQGGTGPF
jgi:EF hand